MLRSAWGGKEKASVPSKVPKPEKDLVFLKCLKIKAPGNQKILKKLVAGGVVGAETLMPQREPQVEEESGGNSDPLALPSACSPSRSEARGFTALLRRESVTRA